MFSSTIKRIALVGLGSIGRRHLRLLKDLDPNLEIILVRSGFGHPCAEECLAEKVVNSIEAALSENVDGAIISSPATKHVEQAIMFLEHGVPVLIEKPLSNKIDDVRDLKDLVANTKIPVLVGYVLRHSADMHELKRLIEKNAIGSVSTVQIICQSYLPNWRPGHDYRNSVSAQQSLGGGVLLELSHELDYANWLFGPFESIEATLCNSNSLDINTEDTAKILLVGKCGATISIYLDFCSPDAIRNCTVAGSKGQILWDGNEKSIALEVTGEKQMTTTFSNDRDLMYTNQLRHFLSCIKGLEKPAVTIDDGIASLRLIESIREASRKKAKVRL